MDKTIIDAIEMVVEEFKEHMKGEIINSDADISAKNLVEELTIQTYYTFSSILEQLKKL